MMLNDVIKSNIHILDGSMASELERNGSVIQNDPLWSASLLYKNPEAIFNVHKSYLENSADIILTASYQASIQGFQKYLGLTIEESKELVKLSVKLANSAREKFGNISKGGKKILIAGSVGPFGAYLADGSEYSGKYCDSMTEKELSDWHRPRIQCLVDAGADLLAFETIPALKEAEALIKLLNEFPNTKAWLSFSSQSMHLTSHSEDIASSCNTCLNSTTPDKLVAIGVNCCSPKLAESLLQDIHATLPDYPLVVYPNSGELWDTKIGWKGAKVNLEKSYLDSYVKSNAKIIGGCCRTDPEDSSHIYSFLQKNKYI